MAQKSSGPQQGARNKLSKNAREKPSVNDHFKEFEEGDKALLQLNASVPEGRVHVRYHGRTVEITGQRGDAYEVKLNDNGKEKTLYVKPIHLEKREE